MSTAPITATTVLSALLLDSTTFSTPSLSSLRSLLQSSTAPSLATSTSDKDLKLYLKHIIAHRTLVRNGVQNDLERFRLLGPKEGAGGGKANNKDATRRVVGQEGQREEEEDEQGEDEQEWDLEEALERLQQEEERLEEEVKGLDKGVKRSRRALDAFVTDLESAQLDQQPSAPPSIKRDLEDTLNKVERDVKRYRGLVEEINLRAANES